MNAAKALYGDDIAEALAKSFDWKDYRAKIISTNGNLYTKWQVHLMLPRELIESSVELRNAILQGFDFNDIKNLLPLPLTRHSGSHPKFTAAVKELIKETKDAGKFLTDKKVIEDVLRRVKKTLEDPRFITKKVNEITKFLP